MGGGPVLGGGGGEGAGMLNVLSEWVGGCGLWSVVQCLYTSGVEHCKWLRDIVRQLPNGQQAPCAAMTPAGARGQVR